MDVILIFNGLGNQMSQYALYLSKKSRHQKVRCLFVNNDHNGIELNSLFGVDTHPKLLDKFLMRCYMWLISPASPLLKRILYRINVKVIKEFDYSYQKEVLESSFGLVFYWGGWHHPKYFERIEDYIREKYTFPSIFDAPSMNVLGGASQSNSIAIHFRRGDYLDKKNHNHFGKVCTDEYYNNAIHFMEEKIKNPIYYIFSDDIEWCRIFMKNKKCVFVDWNTSDDSWKDMFLMSQFKNLIIPNSTFSWWAAFLGRKDKLVCRPPYFMNHKIVPGFFLDNWVEIAN